MFLNTHFSYREFATWYKHSHNGFAPVLLAEWPKHGKRLLKKVSTACVPRVVSGRVSYLFLSSQDNYQITSNSH